MEEGIGVRKKSTQGYKSLIKKSFREYFFIKGS